VPVREEAELVSEAVELPAQEAALSVSLVADVVENEE